MKHYDILIIGGVAAGMSAASQARRARNDLSIGVFEKSNFVSYAACGMPYFISGIVGDAGKLVAIDKEKFIKERKIDIFTNSIAEKIDFFKKQAEINREGGKETYSYDKLVIATGARPVVPSIEGINSKNIFFLRNLDEGLAIKKYIDSNKPSKGIIIGGGSIGLEMAESLRALGIETRLLEKMENIAMMFDDEIRSMIIDELITARVSIRTGVDIKKIEDKDGLTVYYDSESVKTDFIIASTGILPNTGLLSGTTLKMNERGAILVNEKSETNIPDVYAAGDCATVKHLLLPDDVYMPLGTTANKQGRVAGLQAAGIRSERFNGIIGSVQIKTFGLELAKTGLSDADAARYGIKARSSGMQGKSKAGYYPGAENIFVKVTMNSDTHEIIGAQIAGKDGAALRLNVAAAAIAAKMKIEDFAYLDLGYAPPFSPVWDTLLMAAQNLIARK